jgi:hypothetical protein
MTEMNPSPIIQYLRENRMISEDDVDRMSKYESKTYMIKGLQPQSYFVHSLSNPHRVLLLTSFVVSSKIIHNAM